MNCAKNIQPAALFHMAELLKNGSEYYGIIADEVKGEEYYEKARKAGYHC